MDFLSESEDPFLTSSIAALASGEEALEALGWHELLPSIDHDLEARQAVFSVFRAQGRALSTTGALAALMAQPYTGFYDAGDEPVVATIERHSSRYGDQTVIAGRPRRGRLIIDRPGSGVWIVDAVGVDFRPIDLPGGVGLHQVLFEPSSTPITIPDADARTPRQRGLHLGRLALAFDLLGTAEAALALAVEYAAQREQFGQPIGRFQAVRHMLSSARVDCAAVQAVAEQGLDLDGHLPPGYDEIVKAVAGRNSRRVCERALQTFGGIGFTVEHSHHRFHSRVLTMDSLLGTSAHLVNRLGSQSRSFGTISPTVTNPFTA